MCHEASLKSNTYHMDMMYTQEIVYFVWKVFCFNIVHSVIGHSIVSTGEMVNLCKYVIVT